MGKLTPYEGEIADRLEEGYSYREIAEYLYFKYDLKVSRSAIHYYAKANYLTNIVNDVPVCRECPNYVEVGTKHIRNKDRKSNVKVCKACLEVIPNRIKKSPEWCPKRKGGDTN